VAFGAKYNWAGGVYGGDGTTLESDKKKWCAGCHDGRVGVSDSYADINKLIPDWQPSSQYHVGDIVKYDGDAWQCITDHTSGGSPNPAYWVLTDWRVLAPGVMGDDSTYGFYYNGHGQWPGGDKEIHCDGCHDFTMLHIDGVQRTYDDVSDNYRVGYRLRYVAEEEPLIIPRNGEDKDDSYELCMEACHHMGAPHSDIFTPIQYMLTNFRDRNSGINLHTYHLTVGGVYWDSDYDTPDGEADSGMSCPACHNVHGSPTPVMTRHGELMSGPGETDKEPGLDLKWYTIPPDSVETSELMDSNHCTTDEYSIKFGMCETCHALGYYNRVPGGPARIMELIDVAFIRVTDQMDQTKDCFQPGEAIHYHVDFYVTGRFDDPDGWWVQTVPGNSGGYSTVGEGWQDPIFLDPPDVGMYLDRGAHSMCFDRQIPTDAVDGVAHFRMDLRIGQCPPPCMQLDQRLETIDFSIDSECPESP
jgi:hypothetical protein